MTRRANYVWSNVIFGLLLLPSELHKKDAQYTTGNVSCIFSEVMLELLPQELCVKKASNNERGKP